MKVKYRSSPGSAAKWAILRWFDISSNTDQEAVYLRRLRVIQTPWFGIYLHWINEPDTDRFPHDHPWEFWSLVLRGGYVEDVYTSLYLMSTGDGAPDHRNVWRSGSTHRMSVRNAHQIVLIEPRTVTLVVTGPRVREWGFWTDNGFVSWRRYVDEERSS